MSQSAFSALRQWDRRIREGRSTSAHQWKNDRMNAYVPMPVSSVSWAPGDPFWVVVEDEDQVALWRREWGGMSGKQWRVLCWASLPAKAKAIDRLIVYFHANTHSGFRKADRLEHDLRFLVNLRSLEVPVRFAASLSPEQLPSSLQRLSFDGDGKTRGLLPKDRVFAGIRVVDSDNTDLHFEKKSFPDLRELTSRLDRKGSLLDVIASYPSLDSLEIRPVKDTTTLHRLEPCSIERLVLIAGSLPTLEGIQHLRGLRCLALRSLDKLLDISALEMCSSLELLHIQSCARLTDYHPLLKAPALKSLWLHGNRRLDAKACATAFASRP
jgi:hypothetical protein